MTPLLNSNDPDKKQTDSQANVNRIESNAESEQHRVNLQNQTKRQKEWVYLSHYLAIQGLDPVHIISGKDDGNEPDFTLVFWENDQLVYIGVELTTLPRLRTQMSDTGLIAKRWYWQAVNLVAKQNLEGNLYDNENGYLISERFKKPMKTAYMPQNKFKEYRKGRSISIITQEDVDQVMKKKQSKTNAYHSRRPLNELWLLIHTDKYQPDTILSFERSKQTGHDLALTHSSGFDNVQITCYPSYRTLNVLTVTAEND